VVNPLLGEELKENVLNLCRRTVGSLEIVAACLYGPRVCGYADEESDVNVLLVLSEYRPRLRGYLEPLNGVRVFVLAADQGAFERDVDQGWLGESVAEKVAAPYEPLVNGEYLRRQEVKLKRRAVWELLENLVSEFPELSHELLIGAEYFLYESMTRRARLFPPLTYSFLNMLRDNLKEKNVELMMDGYRAALHELAQEGWITFSDGYVKIMRSFAEAVGKRRLPVSSLLRGVQRALFRNVLNVLPKMMHPSLQDQEIFTRSQPRAKVEELTSQIGDSRKHLLMPTSHGLVALSDKTTIEGFVEKAVPGGEIMDMRIEDMGGVLNSVYLLTFRRDHQKQRVVVKRFRDWRSVKWFPLALWAIGTRGFAVLGRSRLEREYAINRFLHSQGFPVPGVLYVSLQERLIFEDYVEGENLVEAVKRAVSARQAALEEAPLMRRVGAEIAEAHQLGVTFGDCKPENIIIAGDGKAYFVDLEQASRDGDMAWDIAEFLYYLGHYASPFSPAEAARVTAREFLEGYLESGGDAETLRKAASIRYTKVFSIFTAPHIVLALSNLCKRAEREVKGDTG